MKQDLESWIASTEYLPAFMRDFHDQKDLFKKIHEVVDNAVKNGKGDRYLENLG